MDHQNDALKHTKSLGKKVVYPKHYDASLLEAVPRDINRSTLDTRWLWLYGEDRWTLYEMSWLNAKGKPVVAVGIVCVDAGSENIVESKSFKLYLNSFNQTSFTDVHEVRDVLTRDLSACVKGQVKVAIYTLDDAPLHVQMIAGTCLDDQDIEITDYQLNTTYLEQAVSLRTSVAVEETLYSHLLKSNCLITNQPDWATVIIRYRGRPIDRAALLRYIVSLREHQEFHEHCVERIFADINAYCQPEYLTVCAKYTRRGGLDINPFRSNFPDETFWEGRLLRQ